MPAVSAEHIAFVYADDLWVADRDGKNAAPAHLRHRRRDRTRSSRPTARPSPSPPSTTATLDVYTIPRRGRRADAADLAPGAGRRPRLHARRQVVLFSSPRAASNNRHTPALHRAARRAGCRRRLPIPYGVRGGLLARRQAHRLHAAPRRDRAVEALPRRHARPHLDLRRRDDHDVDADPAAGGPLQRPRPELGRQHRLLPLRPQRRVQPVRLRHRREGRQAAHAVRATSRSSTSPPTASRSSSSRPATCTPSTPARRRRSG